MDGLTTYSEQIRLLLESLLSTFGRTYPFVFEGPHLKLRQSD